MSEIIDFHVHVTPPEISANWQKYAEKEAYFAMLSGSPRNKGTMRPQRLSVASANQRFGVSSITRIFRPRKRGCGITPPSANKFASAEDVVAELNESQCTRAVIFGFAFKDMGLCRMVNDYVIEAVRRFPEKLTGFISVSPNARGLEKEIDRCHNAGLCGIGEIFPEGQGFNIDNERETRTLAGACRERDIPVIVHTNEPVGHYYPGKNDIPLKKIERFIENSQGLRIVLAHWGGGLLFYEAMPELRKKFRNVYYDTAATPFLYSDAIYRAALDLGLGEKIIFGSDFPLLPLSRYMPPLETLPPAERDLILGGNAERLLAARV